MSIKLIKAGHPWVTLDKFSEKFHPKEKFIVAANRKKPFCLLIHDPTHKDVKARVWATSGKFQQMMKNFKNDLLVRIRKATKARFEKKYLDKRNHFYLVFGENDNIPGLFIRYIDGEILIEFYMEFWRPYQDFIVQNTIKIVNEVFKPEEDIEIENVWIQYRSLNKEVAKCLDPNTTFRRVDVKEYDVNYKVYLGKHYDTGIYTDMAAIRERLKPQFKKSKSLLNLYSYTGAFSLFGMAQGIEKVTSVDLSEKYIEWLEENIDLNKDFKKESHTSMAMSTMEALRELKGKEEKFDFIISDPPSSSSDGNRVSNAIGDYKETLPLMFDLMSPEGQILVFLNTHKISMDKFKNKIKNIIHKNKLPLYLAHNVYLSDDCPYRKGFPEGSYLKGITLKLKKPREEKPKEEQPKKDEKQVKETHVDEAQSIETKKPAKKVAKKMTKKAVKKVTQKATKKKTTKKTTSKKVTSKTSKKSSKVSKKTESSDDSSKKA